jgi:glucose/arabinose dehydrogenase
MNNGSMVSESSVLEMKRSEFAPQRLFAGRLLAALLAASLIVAGVAVAATDPGGTVPEGKGRSVPSLPTTGTTLPPAPGIYRLAPAGRAEQPLAIVVRPHDRSVYVVEKIGRVRHWRANAVGPTVLDLRSVVSTTNEQGLLGLAFHPTDPTRMFVDYTDRNGSIVVSEWRTDSPTDGTPLAVTPGTERVLFSIKKPFNEHNAGTIVFDQSGALLIGIGDGGGSGDPKNNAQRPDVLLGKVLRILPDPADGKPYGIPADNPFAAAAPKLQGNQQRPRAEVLALGLRNPWRISVDRTTGDVWVPDVGQSKFEEINRIPKGAGGQNFGWRNREGRQSFKGGRPKGAVDPLFDYAHADNRCAVVGGFVYRGAAMPQLVGWYLFADVCSGEVMALNPKGWKPASLGLKITYATAFGEGPDGEPWLTSFEGPIARLVPR